MTDAGSQIAFVAGEASGDLIAAPVIAALRAHQPSFRAAGIAGDRMIAAGCEPWHHVRELSVRGYAEVLRELPRLVRMRRALARRLCAGGSAALVGVDAPDFNLALEAKVREAGIPTIHYVSPSIWAWRAQRIERIRRAADRVLLVFPFEQEIYDKAGIAASYVGHPLASEIPLQADRASARRRLGLDPGGPIICLMPGSRKAEIDCLAPVFFAAAGLLAHVFNGVRFIVPLADPSLRPHLEDAYAGAERIWERARQDICIVAGQSHDCLAASDGVLVASGTATLEAALFKRPMVIAYRMPAASAWIMRRIGGYLPWVGLPNILARETLVPELLQERATPQALAETMQTVLADEPGQRRLAERYAALHESLRRDTPALASEAILHTIALARTGR